MANKVDKKGENNSTSSKKKQAQPSRTQKSVSQKSSVSKKSSVKKASNNKAKTAVKKSPEKTQITTVPSRKEEGKVSKKSIKSNKEIQIDDYSVNDNDSAARGDVPMTIVDHLDEFRSRLLISLVTIIVLTCAAFFVSDYLLSFIMKPFLDTGQKLNIFKLAGGFIIRLKVSVAAALILGVPIFIYQIWRYILPAISLKDRTFSRLSILAAILLFYSGVAFVFFLLMPFAIPMLLSFIGSDMVSTIGADDYLSFTILFSVAMGVLYELPIVVMILTRIGILNPQFLIKKRKYSIVIIWIVAALITPQDVLSQVMVAVPLMFLYEISIIISKAVFLRKHKRDLINKQI